MVVGAERALADRVAIVTGAATGIGKGIAGRLAADGPRVVVNHLDTPAGADAVVQAICKDGGTAVGVQADIGRREECARLFADAAGHYGRVDILVNNAAVAILTPIAEASEEQIDTVLNVNVKGMLFGCQLLPPGRRIASATPERHE
jgi:NAD(P)-dependent dehydrogenase (short-subunit alcohol dehydrogenase family)